VPDPIIRPLEAGEFVRVGYRLVGRRVVML